MSILSRLFVKNKPELPKSGDGTMNDPYQISTRLHLDAITLNSSSSYILVNDIDLEGIVYKRAVIAPCAGGAKKDIAFTRFNGVPFTGSFNGNGFVIRNLRIFALTKEYVGLFGLIGEGGTVSNLGVEDCDIHGDTYVGGLCGDNFSGIITSSYTTGTVRGNCFVGGLCGTNRFRTISSSHSDGRVSGLEFVGGLCGSNEGAIYSSHAANTVSGEKFVGGLCGYNEGRIISSHATGSTTGNESVGILCGYNASASR